MTEPITNTDTQVQPVELTRAEERIRQLSEKVELTSRERDEKANLLKDRDTRIAELEKENSFNSGFVDILSTHPAAKDHKDEIKAKVLSGYSAEDAALAVLAKAGKLGAIAPTPTAQVAGGSASTVISQTGEKSVQEMTQSERRDALSKMLTIG